MNKITRLAAAVVLSGLLLAAPAAQAAPALLGASANFELEVNEMELEITADDPRPKAYLYTGGQSDYYFIVWMSSNPTVAAVDGDGRVTGRSAGEATITAITDRGECAACKVTVRKESGDAASKKPALDHTTLNLVIQYNNAHPSQKLQLINTSGSFVYAYQWMSSNPEVATVSDKGLVTAQAAGTTTITAMVSNGQALRCSVRWGTGTRERRGGMVSQRAGGGPPAPGPPGPPAGMATRVPSIVRQVPGRVLPSGMVSVTEAPWVLPLQAA